jgi:hypothetical protein
VWFRRNVRQLCPRRSCGPNAPHVPLDRALRDPDAEFQELPSNPLGAPEPVVGRHLADKGDGVGRDTRFVWRPRAGLPTPEKSESLPVPPQQRLGLNQQQGMLPLTMEAREQHEHAALVNAKSWALDRARSDDELLPKDRVLGDQLDAGAG